MTRAPRPPALDALTGIRYLAALHVVVFHAIHGAGYFLDWVPPGALLTRFIDGAFVSVSLFFVLSGFILAYNYDRAESGGAVTDLRRFWVARVARVYPMYLISFVAILPFIISRDTDYPMSPLALFAPDLRIVSYFTLTQSWLPERALMWNSPAWSIAVEAFFYLAFPLVMPLLHRIPRRAEPLAFAGLWLAAILPAALWCQVHPELVAKAFTDRSATTSFIKFFPPLRLPEFMMGLMAGRRFLRDGPPSLSLDHVAAWCFGLVALVLVVEPGIPFPIAHNGLYDPLFALALYALACARDPLGRFLAHPVVVHLGEASYGVYLLHVPVLIWYRLMFRSAGVEPGPLLQVGYIVVATLTASLCFTYLERPMRAFIMRWSSAPAVARPPRWPWWPAALAGSCALIMLCAYHHTTSAPLWSEKASIGRALAAGRGFADPFFGEHTGPTAWCAPLLPALIGSLFALGGGSEAFVTGGLVALNAGVLIATACGVTALAWQTTRRAWAPALLVVLGLATHTWFWFQRVDDCGLYMLLLEAQLAFACWWPPLARAPRAALWGALGGVCALANPVAACVWGALTLALAVPARAWRAALVAGAVAIGVMSPWIVRNALVFGRLIPMKSNLAYEVYQSQVLQPDGVLELTHERAGHPRNDRSPDGREYRRLGESGFLARKRTQLASALVENPGALGARIALRLWAATLWYVPYDRADARNLPYTVLVKRLVHPLPFLAVLVLLGRARRRALAAPQRIAILMYAAYLAPYVATSYYERYAVPLDAVKILLVIWALYRPPDQVITDSTSE